MLLLLLSVVYFGAASASAQQQLVEANAVRLVAPLVASSEYVRASMELRGAADLVWAGNTEANYRAAQCSTPGLASRGRVCH